MTVLKGFAGVALLATVAILWLVAGTPAVMANDSGPPLQATTSLANYDALQVSIQATQATVANFAVATPECALIAVDHRTMIATVSAQAPTVSGLNHPYVCIVPARTGTTLEERRTRARPKPVTPSVSRLAANPGCISTFRV